MVFVVKDNEPVGLLKHLALRGKARCLMNYLFSQGAIMTGLPSATHRDHFSPR